MPADYKNRPRSQPQKKKAPGWVWMLAGLLVGLFVAFLVYLREHREAHAPAPAAVSQPAPPTRARPEQAQRPPPEKPRFEFYSILPEMEIPVPESAVPLRSDPDEPAGQPAQPGGTYLLQVGSFRSYEEADRLKARLALLGLEAAIQTVAIDGSSTWHRVRLGPFTDPARLNRTRARLSEHDFESIVLKVRT